MKLSCLALMVTVGSLFASAKTVALWPFEQTFGQKLPLRCLVDSANDIQTCAPALSNVSPGWILPGNPDTSFPLRGSAENKMSLRLSGSGQDWLNASTVGRLIRKNADYTFEGWLFLDRLPSSSEGWWMIWDAHPGVSNERILLAVFRKGEGRYTWQIGGNKDVVLLSEADFNASEWTNQWMHVALTHKTGPVNDTYTLYRNGEAKGSCLFAASTAEPTTTDMKFFGRGDEHNFRGYADYFRISDQVLQPSEFLCAGIPKMPSSTLAYWKLDTLPDGTLDYRDSIGLSDFHAPWRNYGTGDGAIMMGIGVGASRKSAFPGNPPNPTVVLPDGNAGSVKMNRNTALCQFGIGYELTVTNSWTVEGWICPEKQKGDAAQKIQYIFNTRASSSARAWSLALQCVDAAEWTTPKFTLCAQDGGTEATFLVYDKQFPNQGNLKRWGGEWKHVALVYDYEVDNGVWTCYLDGSSMGSITNAFRPTTDVHIDKFFLGGRYDECGSTVTGKFYPGFSGYMDCFRVSKAALTADQLMIGSSAAPNVIALWPLNSANGYNVSTIDLMGTYHFCENLGVGHNPATPCTLRCPVSNPERSEKLCGYPVTNTASAVFKAPSLGGNASRPCLEAGSLEIQNLFNDASRAWTVEGFFYRTAMPSQTELFDILFLTKPVGENWNGVFFAFRNGRDAASRGFDIWTLGGPADQFWPDTYNEDGLNRWQHIALTATPRTVDGVAGHDYTLYVDGVSKGVIWRRFPTSRIDRFDLGGRDWSDDSFHGAIANVRISTKALVPEEFLNAASGYAAPTSSEKRTLGFWKLDDDDGVLNTVNAIGGAALANVSTTSSPSGFSSGIPQGDASAGFIGNPRQNHGSAVFSAHSSLSHADQGAGADIKTPFTVEGWMKWDGLGGQQSMAIVGSSSCSPQYIGGWWLELRDCGNGRVGLAACAIAPYQTMLVDTCFDFDFSGLAHAWHHIAVTYDPMAGNGTWSLLIDGQAKGGVENFFAPIWNTGSNLIKFGATANDVSNGWLYPFVGQLDCWRLSLGVLDRSDLLCRSTRTLLLLR